jgi:hypothetical protein
MSNHIRIANLSARHHDKAELRVASDGNGDSASYMLIMLDNWYLLINLDIFMDVRPCSAKLDTSSNFGLS